MNEQRPVRCELTMEEADLITSVLKEQIGRGRDDDAINSLLGRLQGAADGALEHANVRGPAGDAAEYEW